MKFVANLTQSKMDGTTRKHLGDASTFFSQVLHLVAIDRALVLKCKGGRLLISFQQRFPSEEAGRAESIYIFHVVLKEE